MSGSKMMKSDLEMIVKTGKNKTSTIVNITGETSGTYLKGTEIMRTVGSSIRYSFLDRIAMRQGSCPNSANFLKVCKRAVL